MDRKEIIKRLEDTLSLAEEKRSNVSYSELNEFYMRISAFYEVRIESILEDLKKKK